LQLSLKDELAKLGEISNITKNKVKHPAGWEPGIEWDGTKGIVNTGAIDEAPKDWSSILQIWGLDPKEIEIIEPIQLRAWDAPDGNGGTRRMFYYRAQVRKKSVEVNNVDLIDVVKSWKPIKRSLTDHDGSSFIVAYADTQIGKIDGGGSEEIVNNVLDKTDLALIRLKELRKLGRKISSIYLPQLGDCIEGFNSGGGNRSWRNDMDLTSQIRVYRRLLLHIVKTFGPYADKVIVPCVPGNHDEAVRQGNQMATSYTDSFALDAASAVADALKENSDYDHVSFVFPKFDTLSITLDVSNTTIGFIHGHQTRNKAVDWWAKQAHGMQPIGDASILLSGHFHHLVVQQSGAKTWIQMPALDGGSNWFEERTGQSAPAGLVTLVVNNNKWKDLAIL
jgi:predicted phosphodiesterase